MSKQKRIVRIFRNLNEYTGRTFHDFSENAIWMAARELSAGNIKIMLNGPEGGNESFNLSPSEVMRTMNKAGTSSGFVVHIDEGTMFLEGRSGGGLDATDPLTWDDILSAGRTQREAPDKIMIDGREYTLHSSHPEADSAERERDKVRENGKNAQIRKKGGMFRVYVRDKAPKKAKPAKKPAKKAAKKAAKKKAPAKKAAKKAPAKKKAGGKGKV